MKGYIYVGPAGTKTEQQVAPWVEQSAAFVATVEKKPRKGKKPLPKRLAELKKKKRG